MSLTIIAAVIIATAGLSGMLFLYRWGSLNALAATQAQLALTQSQFDLGCVLSWLIRSQTIDAEEMMKSWNQSKALERLIAEATSLSPMKPNGDHDATISADALSMARAAIRTVH